MQYQQKEPSRRSLRRVRVNPRRERTLTRAETRTYPDATPRPGTTPVVYVRFGGAS